ncbi:50S ribosomal protein L14P [Lasiodiplodia theobromae]|uniref:Uncharacterized protein n=1 Tax=Lasiodiplodia theobromae TaxID=45133 RepID=A0A5N5DDZ0_9PEZI|nr:50S ribosomal protein L14P [Lasiodiplodia theobromae]KAB2575234.1 hypothetical protein DBV05_g6154 [Lasiodiplodia theobromae]KAF4541994.1 50S ribosomal protein L14P [Lasiodiplodia theobromae]
MSIERNYALGGSFVTGLLMKATTGFVFVAAIGNFVMSCVQGVFVEAQLKVVFIVVVEVQRQLMREKGMRSCYEEKEAVPIENSTDCSIHPPVKASLYLNPASDWVTAFHILDS